MHSISISIMNSSLNSHSSASFIYTTHSTQTFDGAKDKKVAFTSQIGMLSSALEHTVPEQMFSNPKETDPSKKPQGFSAVKALSLAAAQGQRIYTITPANQNTALPQLRLDALAMSEIRQALAVGKTVTTHTDLLTVPGYKGAGYILADADTGDAVYKISGGKNGGFVYGFGLGLVIFTIIPGIIAGSGVFAIIGLIGAVLGAGLMLGAIIRAVYNSFVYGDPLASIFTDKGCIAGGFVSGMGGAGLLTLVAPIWGATLTGIAASVFAAVAGLIGFVSSFMPSVSGPTTCLQIK